MQFRLLAAILLLFFVSCKNQKTVAPTANISKISQSKLSKKYQSNSFANAKFETVKIDAKSEFKTGRSSQKIALKYRIAKGEKIWLSANFLGFPIAKLLIDKDSVHYYNKFDKTFFNGSFEFIQQMMGVDDLNYQALENLFVGDLLLDPWSRKYKSSIENNSYVLAHQKKKTYLKKATFYPFTFKPKSQIIENIISNKTFAINYKKHQNIDGLVFPKSFEIKATTPQKNIKASIQYQKVIFNQKLRFPFTVPKECTKEIVLKNKINLNE